MIEINVFTVALLALGTAIATGFGALPFLFTHGLEGRRLGIANALAAGLMLAASAMLMVEGVGDAPLSAMAGFALGGAAVWIAGRLLPHDEALAVGALTGANAAKAVLIMGVMTAHSFAEGVGVGVSFGGGDALGLFITAAIAVHNIPEGLAIALVLVPRGVSVWAAAGLAVVSSLPQPILAVPAFLAVETFRAVLAPGLGFAAGAMVVMAATELLPEAAERLPRRSVFLWTAAAMGAGYVAQLALSV